MYQSACACFDIVQCLVDFKIRMVSYHKILRLERNNFFKKVALFLPNLLELQHSKVLFIIFIKKGRKMRHSQACKIFSAALALMAIGLIGSLKAQQQKADVLEAKKFETHYKELAQKLDDVSSKLDEAKQLLKKHFDEYSNKLENNTQSSPEQKKLTQEECAALLADIENTLNPKKPSLISWALPNLSKPLSRLAFQISGMDPDIIAGRSPSTAFSEGKIKKIAGWISAASNQNIVVPAPLKSSLTKHIAELIKNRPSYQAFTLENKSIKPEEYPKLQPLLNRLGKAFSSLLNILKDLDNSPLFSPMDYINKDTDIAALDSDVKVINIEINKYLESIKLPLRY
ncbi:MAG: hypothetical protein US49_C0006G0111 [candidate division TM6 bacterium GW2011_GWF2_37_49]|nr:MAG: hypothetical protein US49_C0006G0111 [candidate division TM6 bacterium GW2011_GWF2_37_49]